MRYGWELDDYDWALYAAYQENEKGEMEYRRTFFVPTCEYLELKDGKHYVVSPLEREREMENWLNKIKATGKRASTRNVALGEKPIKKYTSWKSYLRK